MKHYYWVLYFLFCFIFAYVAQIDGHVTDHWRSIFWKILSAEAAFQGWSSLKVAPSRPNLIVHGVLLTLAAVVVVMRFY